MTDIDFDELDKAVNSLMSKQRAAENKTDAGEDTASGVSLASGSENSSEFANSTVSSAENASSAPVDNSVGGNIPVSVSHSSPVMQTPDSQDTEAPAAKIGTETPKPSPNTEAEANAVKITTSPSVPVSSPTSSVPVAASVAGQPSVPARSLTPSASPVPSAATKAKPPTVSSAPADSSAPVAAPSTSTTPSATTASAAPITATAPAATTNPPTPAPSSVPLSSSSSPNSVVTPVVQKPKPAASTVSVSSASTTPAAPSAPSSSSSGSTVSSSGSPSGHAPEVTPAVSPPPAAPPESDTVHVSPMIAKRPHGRFMDVVHPSSKSKIVQQRKMTPNASTSGLGGRSGADSANKDDSANLADKGVRRPSMIGGGDNLNNIHSSESNSSVDAPTSANSEKSLLSSVKKRVVLPQNPEGKTNDSSDVATPVQSKSESTAPVSPFISNVEVEKRPLGTPAATDDANDGGAATAKNDDHKKSLANYTPRKLDVSEDDPDDEVEPGGDVGLPPEFSADVMAAEEADVSSLDAAVDDIKAAEQRASKKPSDDDDVSPRHSPKKASTEPEPRPMFDAASRTSKNFDPKEESKSGWLTVLLILLFLAIGVAGGAAAYFLLIK